MHPTAARERTAEQERHEFIPTLTLDALIRAAEENVVLEAVARSPAGLADATQCLEDLRAEKTAHVAQVRAQHQLV